MPAEIKDLYDPATQRTFERLHEKQSAKICADFNEYVGLDLASEADALAGVEDRERLAQLGAWLVAQWLTHRESAIEALRNSGEIKTTEAA